MPSQQWYQLAVPAVMAHRGVISLTSHQCCSGLLAAQSPFGGCWQMLAGEWANPQLGQIDWGHRHSIREVAVLGKSTKLDSLPETGDPHPSVGDPNPGTGDPNPSFSALSSGAPSSRKVGRPKVQRGEALGSLDRGCNVSLKSTQAVIQTLQALVCHLLQHLVKLFVPAEIAPAGMHDWVRKWIRYI